ncbi:MAG: fumarate hydratase C-terminal domain-containing protein [Deltaproteobacteria bacterium]|nr:fumarate hydratase C-terminal domain-containing protein [Deltaproteobacteria bacterium]
MKTVHLTSPVSEEALRDLDAGDSVTISGRVFTCRSLTYDRLIDPEGGETVRKRLKELGAETVFHSGPLVKEGPDRAEMVALVPMPSWLAGREKIEKAVGLLDLKLIIGKGMLEGLEAFCKQAGCVHLVCAGNYNEYAARVTRVIDCAWPELGRPEAMWIMEVDGLGPLIVDADTKGRSLYQDIDEGFKSDAAALLEELDIKLD